MSRILPLLFVALACAACGDDAPKPPNVVTEVVAYDHDGVELVGCAWTCCRHHPCLRQHRGAGV